MLRKPTSLLLKIISPLLSLLTFVCAFSTPFLQTPVPLHLPCCEVRRARAKVLESHGPVLESWLCHLVNVILSQLFSVPQFLQL